MQPTPEENTVAEVGPADASPVAPQGIDTGLLIVVAAIVTSVIQGMKRSGALRLISTRWIPVVSVGLAVAGTVATSITNGHTLAQSLVEGVLAGLSATGLYELGKPRPAQATEEAA
jgi:hypothetical protein